MQTKSINFKLLSLMILAFLLTAVGVILLAGRQVNKIIDKSQYEVYNEKLDSILGFVSRNYKGLQDTLMVEAYEEQFKSKAVRAMQNDYYTNIDAHKNIYPFIIDATGRVVMHPMLAAGTDMSKTGFIKQIIADKNGNFNYYFDGQQKWMVFKHFQGWNWFVGYAIPLDIKYADSRQIRNVLILIVSVIAAIVASVLSIILTKFTKPIIELTKVSVEMAAGKLDSQIAVNRKDEIGVLAQSFEKMRLAVRDKITLIEQKNIEQNQTLEQLKNEVVERKKAELKLEKINQTLEMLVDDRTANLAETVEKLNESNKQLEHFCYIASHDMREPLRKITAFGTMLRKSVSGKITEDDAENLGYMINGADRLSEMIEGLLAYSRVNTKGQQAQQVNLNQIVEQLQKIELSVLLEEKHAEVEISQELPTVLVDPVQIRQLMQNLIANGIKYQSKDNKPHILITANPAADDMVKIEVKDNGIGIKPEYHQAVFEMFRRLHSRSEYDGTGIGLAVCKKIVERHGGKIGVESQFGQGSTFWFTLPLAGKTEPAPLTDNIASDKR